MIFYTLKVILSELRVESNFEKNWYTWCAGQMGHVLMGMLLVLYLTHAYTAYFGEAPYKLHLMVFSLVTYFLVWETLLQKSKNIKDKIEDSMFFVLYGSGSAVSAFTETNPGDDNFDVNTSVLIGFSFVALLHLFYGASTRIWKAARDER